MSTEKGKRSTPKNQCRERSAPERKSQNQTDKPPAAPITRRILSWLSRRRFLKHIGDVAKMVITAIIAERLTDHIKPRPRVRTSKADQSLDHLRLTLPSQPPPRIKASQAPLLPQSQPASQASLW